MDTDQVTLGDDNMLDILTSLPGDFFFYVVLEATKSKKTASVKYDV